MFINPEQSSWKPYDCVYQGWAIIAFGTPDKNTIEQLNALPHVVGVFDDREYAIKLAKAMRQLGSDKYNKDYHFVVQGVGINAEWPILGLNVVAMGTGDLGKADKTAEVI